ncbi:MerR family transcriptional regulator [Streptomyces nitrosporeus]|uniref:MerR family transcriptional regulator n=1 Tax=Streptomyces nitrosporeus TaxID=28894 RepID=UPI00332D24C8
MKFSGLCRGAADTGDRTCTIKEAAALTGPPAGTLRYYGSAGVIAPVARGESSGHRICTEADPDLLTGVACLAAAGMSVRDMRDYVETGRLGPDGRSSSSRCCANAPSAWPGKPGWSGCGGSTWA